MLPLAHSPRMQQSAVDKDSLHFTTASEVYKCTSAILKMNRQQTEVDVKGQLQLFVDGVCVYFNALSFLCVALLAENECYRASSNVWSSGRFTSI